ncbi:MAG: acyl carrier protein [Myxococcales bacterium]|nr:acyl carrier protein [Myxococcales bacterium]
MARTTYSSVLSELLKLLERYAPGIHITEDSQYGADLALPSVEVMDLVNEIEDHFEVTIPLNDIPSLNTVGMTARYLTDLLGGDKTS